MDKKPLIGKCLAIGIILLFVGTCIIPAIAQDTEKSLPTSRGNWLYVGGSGPGNYTKIQDAIDNASDGDTVFVYGKSSPYQDSIRINKSILLKGENPETTVIKGIESVNTIDIQTNNVCLTGFTIENGYYAVTNNNVIISNCTVFNNIFDGNYAGVRFEYSFNLTITDNYFFENHFALVIRNSHNVIVSLNTINLNVEGNEYVTISLNSIEENSDLGISIYKYPLHTFIPDNYQVFSNIIKNNFQGIFSDEESGLFKDNIIESNYIGLNLANCVNTIISNNLIKNNSIALNINDGRFNIISMNNFIQNERDAVFHYELSVEFRRPHNIFRQNYWDNNTLLGPKRIKGEIYSYCGGLMYIEYTWFCFDWFPAKEPYTIP